jgi:ribosome-associated toxin RatA of RatAB toxin-antitoxin module
MHTANSIVMNAPKPRIFEIAANLEKWPTFLPHYRYIHYLERGANRNVVRMAARRGNIPVSWVSEEVIDPDKYEVRFRHLKAWTKGMEVVWTFVEQPSGVLVSIAHELHFRIPPLSPIAEPIIGGFFISYVANQTLKHMKAYVENLPRRSPAAAGEPDDSRSGGTKPDLSRRSKAEADSSRRSQDKRGPSFSGEAEADA